VEPFGPMFAADIRKRRVAHMRGYPQWRWHLDEAFVKVNGKLCYLWRAVDHEGEVLEAVVTATVRWHSAVGDTQAGSGGRLWRLAGIHRTRLRGVRSDARRGRRICLDRRGARARALKGASGGRRRRAATTSTGLGAAASTKSPRA